MPIVQNPFTWNEIITGDPGTLVNNFYTQMFDWQFTCDPAVPYWYIAMDDDKKIFVGGIGKVGNTPGFGKTVTFYVQVPNVSEALTKAESLGATCVMGVTPIPAPNGMTYTIAMFADPQNNVIGLIEPPQKSA